MHNTEEVGHKMQYLLMMDRAYEFTTKLAAATALSPDEVANIAEAFALRAKAHRRDIRTNAVPYRRPDEDQFARRSLIPLEVDLAARSWAFRLHLLAHAKVGHWMKRVAEGHITGTDPMAKALQEVLRLMRQNFVDEGVRPAIDTPSDAHRWLEDLFESSPFEMDVLATTTGPKAEDDTDA